MYESRIDVSQDIRKGVAALLQVRLSDALDLEAEVNQARWKVIGGYFFQLHELFDKPHDEAEEFAEVLAERITALGGIADGLMRTTAKATSPYEYPPDARAGHSHLKLIASALGDFGTGARAAINEAERIGDADTANIWPLTADAWEAQSSS